MGASPFWGKCRWLLKLGAKLSSEGSWQPSQYLSKSTNIHKYWDGNAVYWVTNNSCMGKQLLQWPLPTLSKITTWDYIDGTYDRKNIAKGTTDPRVTKVTSWGHITNPYTNLDQISSLESRFSVKHQQQSTDLTSASKSRLNLNAKILTNPYAQSEQNQL